MFIAHLPAAYLLTRAIQRTTGHMSPALLWTGLCAGLFPDLDLFYFYLIDNRQTLHHHYLTHTPMAWLAAAFLGYAVLGMLRKRQYCIYVTVVLANVLLHMLLDSVAAGIRWLYPFSAAELNMVTVPARYDWFVWSFILHWTFGLELLIIGAALWLWRSECTKTS